MNVLMFGWEFPPITSGGLGTACKGLVKGLKNNNVNVNFVMPKVPADLHSDHAELISANDVSFTREEKDLFTRNVTVTPVPSTLTPYATNETYKEYVNEYLKKLGSDDIKFGRSGSSKKVYGKDLYDEVYRYRQKAKLVALGKSYDIIHCHDWMTYGAGIEAKKLSGKPLICHIHATEFDRTGDNPNQHVYSLEKEGFEAADMIVAVSEYTRQKVINNYHISPEKVTVVHNAVEFNDFKETQPSKFGDEKIVLFLGRITIQKGPDWFLYTARKVLDHYPDVKFVMAGSGDMESFIIHKATEMGMGDKVLFTGFLKGDDIDRAYQMADLYVMPSISEPFGITPLEAMRNGTPVLISKQSGVSEVITHCLKADFWDIDDMADKIVSVLKHSTLKHEISRNGSKEIKKFNWDKPAQQCAQLYEQVVARS